MRNHRFVVAGLVLATLAGVSGARALDEPFKAAELFQMVQEESHVVTASRRPQPIAESPVDIDAITAEEIRASGAVNVWDLLRLRAGVDVVEARPIGGNQRAIVSVRGFPNEFITNLLVMMDGRIIFNPLTNVLWAQLPVQIQDIDRIEIVRGPNAALYGSNAGLGVINIITKRGMKKIGASAEILGGQQELFQTAVSVENASEVYGWRLSHTYRQDVGHSRTSGVNANDDLLSDKVNLRGWWTPWEGTGLDVAAGYSYTTLGIDVSPLARDFRQRNHENFLMTKLHQKTGGGSTLEVTLARSEEWIENAPLRPQDFKSRNLWYDVDVLERFGWFEDRLQTSVGVSYHDTLVASNQRFRNDPKKRNVLRRVYLQQSVKVVEPLTLMGAVSSERSTDSGDLGAYNFAAVYTPWENQTFRASHGYAPTQVPVSHRHSNFLDAGGVLLIRGNPTVSAPKLKSWELGYQGAFLDKKLKAGANLFYMDIKDLVQLVVKAGFPIPLTFTNYDHAIARGVETELKYAFGPGQSVYANYTYEYVSDTANDYFNIRGTTPWHKFNLGGMTPLAWGFSAWANMGYKDAYHIFSLSRQTRLDVRAYTRLDLRLAYTTPGKAFEYWMAWRDATRPNHREYPDGQTVPSSFYGGASWRF